MYANVLHWQLFGKKKEVFDHNFRTKSLRMMILRSRLCFSSLKNLKVPFILTYGLDLSRSCALQNHISCQRLVSTGQNGARTEVFFFFFFFFFFFLRFIEKFLHTRYVYMYININLQEKYRQCTHSKFKFQQTFGIPEEIHLFHITFLKASHHT